jgi:hypothetical protein
MGDGLLLLSLQSIDQLHGVLIAVDWPKATHQNYIDASA